MGNKHVELTRDEIDTFCLREDVSAELHRIATTNGKAPQEIRVLDLGCGRGTTVLKLLALGFDAYGVDIDPEPIRNGRNIFIQSGHSPDKRLLVISAGEKLPFNDDFFDVVLSDQVFEHISDLESEAKDLARITCLGGIGLHFFPAKWNVVEPHVFVPFVHWLPKNRLRVFWLKLHSHRLPAWYGHEQLSSDQRIEVFYKYLNLKTYYRSPSQIIRQFQKAGLQAAFRPGRGSAVGDLPLCLLRSMISLNIHEMFFVTQK